MSNVDRTKLNALIPNLEVGQVANPELRQVVFEQIYALLELRALETDVLLKTNTTAFTPTADYHPSTKKYTNDEITAMIATVLTKTNTTPYTPTTDYHPTTLRYVVDAINEAIVNVGATAIIQTGTVFPATPTAGQSFFKTDENRLYVYSGAAWVGYALKQQENWIAPTLLNAWVNLAAGTNVAGYYKDSLGVVHLKGMIKSGTVGQVLFILPVGYRPSAMMVFTVLSHNGSADIYTRMEILATGEIQFSSATGGNNYLSLENIHFRAEQ